jgi:hypothetical protein
MSPARPPTHTNSAPRPFHDACGDGVQPPALKAIEQPELDLGSDWEYVLPPAFWPTSPTPACRCCGWATTSSSCLPRNPRPPAATDRGPDTLDVPLVDCGGQRLLRRTGLSEVMNRVELRPQSRTTTLGLAIHPDGSSYPARVISGRNPEQPAGQPRGPLHDTARLLLGALLLAVQGVAYLECAGEQRDRQLRHAQLLSRKGRCRVHTLRAPTPTWFS